MTQATKKSPMTGSELWAMATLKTKTATGAEITKAIDTLTIHRNWSPNMVRAYSLKSLVKKYAELFPVQLTELATMSNDDLLDIFHSKTESESRRTNAYQILEDRRQSTFNQRHSQDDEPES